jgi:hypothetical protein
VPGSPLVTIVRFLNGPLGQTLRECARLIHLAPALLPAGLGLLPSQQANVAEELRALLQDAAAVDQKALADQPQGLTGREADSKASN